MAGLWSMVGAAAGLLLAAGLQGQAGLREILQKAAKDNDGAVNVTTESGKSYTLGRPNALLIAVQDYSHKGFPSLSTPKNDVESLRRVLIDKYGFEEDRVQVLCDADATREGVLEALEGYATGPDELDRKDDLLVYFAGHGIIRSKHQDWREGYWITHVPAHEEQRYYRWVSFSEYSRALNRLRARHVLTIADACYSGGLLRNVGVEVPAGVLAMWEKPSRRILTAGGEEPVSDSGRPIDGVPHSLFAFHLLRVLEDYDGGFLVDFELAARVKQAVGFDTDLQQLHGTDQLPQFGKTRHSSGEGHFIFCRSDVGVAGSVSRKVELGLEKHPGYVLPRSVRAEARKGGVAFLCREGGREVEMVLVEPGRFTATDSGKLHREEHPFLIDRFEVTNARIRAWIDAGADLEGDLGRSTDSSESRDEDPAFNLHLDEARKFAGWAGKQLPTERQWELAAGFHGDKASVSIYPWGGDPAPADALRGGRQWQQLDRSFDVASHSGACHMVTSLSEMCELHGVEAASAVGRRGVARGTSDVLSPTEWRKFRNRALPLDVRRRQELNPTQRGATLGFRCIVPLIPPVRR